MSHFTARFIALFLIAVVLTAIISGDPGCCGWIFVMAAVFMMLQIDHFKRGR